MNQSHNLGPSRRDRGPTRRLPVSRWFRDRDHTGFNVATHGPAGSGGPSPIPPPNEGCTRSSREKKPDCLGQGIAPGTNFDTWQCFPGKLTDPAPKALFEKQKLVRGAGGMDQVPRPSEPGKPNSYLQKDHSTAGGHLGPGLTGADRGAVCNRGIWPNSRGVLAPTGNWPKPCQGSGPRPLRYVAVDLAGKVGGGDDFSPGVGVLQTDLRARVFLDGELRERRRRNSLPPPLVALLSVENAPGADPGPSFQP